MGFFDKLLNGIKSDIQSEIKKQIDSAFNNSTENKTEVKEIPTQPVVDDFPEEYDYFYENCFDTNEDYFDKLVTQENFPDYTIEKNIHPSVFDSNAHPKCFPITYLFKKYGDPVLAIFLMRTCQYRSMPAEGSYTILTDNNIKYIRFFKGMKNEESYVINRIKENL